MATIDKKLIHFNRKADFEARLAAGDIRNYSIVCIKDAKLIWTHGEYYGDLSECLTKYPQEFTKEEKDQMLENLGYYAVEWDGVSETIELSDEEYRKVLSATNVMLIILGEVYLLPAMKTSGAYGYNLVSDEFVGAYALGTNANPLSITSIDFYTPSKTSDLENDSSFVSAVDTGEEVDNVETEYVTEAEFNSVLSGKQDTITDLSTIRSGASKGATAVQSSDLSKVATSGSYNDLTNKPTIPSAVTESTVSSWGFTKNTGTYSKPSTGIPKSDLDDSVQTSLGKADTALQSVPSEYVTENELTGKNYATNTALQTAMRSTEMKLSELELSLDGKQPVLVSGTNIKTINGTSILGSGDIEIESGGGSEVPIVDHGTGETTFVLTPNILHKWGTVTSLTFTLAVPTDTTVANYYMFQFTCGSTATSLNLPDTIKWIAEPSIEANKTYQISILDNLGVIGGA